MIDVGEVGGLLDLVYLADTTGERPADVLALDRAGASAPWLLVTVDATAAPASCTGIRMVGSPASPIEYRIRVRDCC